MFGGKNTSIYNLLFYKSCVHASLSVLQFRGDLVLRPEAEDREVIDEIVASGRPLRENGVVGRLHGAALELPLRVEIAVEAVARLALVVAQRADHVAVARLEGQGHYTAVIAARVERDRLDVREVRVAADRSRSAALLVAAVNQGRRLADRRPVRTELLAVVNAGSAVLPETRAARTVLGVAEARACRADARLVARLERRERHVRLECREIRWGAPRFK